MSHQRYYKGNQLAKSKGGQMKGLLSDNSQQGRVDEKVVLETFCTGQQVCR